MVSFAEGDEGGDDMVSGRVAVVEGLVTEPVGKGVDAEGGLLDEEDAEDAGIDESAHPVAPSETADERREDETHGDDDLDVVLVLPDDDGVLVQVGDVSTTDALGVLLHDHPADVGVEQPLADGVRVLVGVGVAVVGTVVASPPSDRSLHGTTTDGSQVDSQGESGRVRAVSPEAMVSYSR